MFGVSRKALVVMVGCAICAPALADDVSTDSIINALRSGGGEGTRGIHLLQAPASTPVPATAVQPVNYGRGLGPSATPIRPRMRVLAPTEAPVRAPIATERAEQGSHQIDLTVQFANNSATLTPEAMRTLAKLGRALTSSDLAANHFRIEGHTDSLGGRAYNQTLSGQRAQRVVEYLVENFGVSADRLQPVGLGAERPLVPTPDNVPESRNRRVTVVNTGE